MKQLTSNIVHLTAKILNTFQGFCQTELLCLVFDGSGGGDNGGGDIIVDVPVEIVVVMLLDDFSGCCCCR